MTNTGAIRIAFKTWTADSSAGALVLNTWLQVYASFSLVNLAGNRAYRAVYVNGSPAIATSFQGSVSMSVAELLPTDAVGFGRFNGYIGNLEIYSPASPIVNKRIDYILEIIVIKN